MTETQFGTIDIPEDGNAPIPETAKARKARELREKEKANKAAVRKAKKAADKKAAKKPKAKAAPVAKEANGDLPLADTCQICGKPLTKRSSQENGMGDVCSGKAGLLPAGVSFEEHIAKHTVPTIPKGFIKVKDAHVAVMEGDIVSGYRFIQAFGGNTLLGHVHSEVFKVVYVNGIRYISKKCLQKQHLTQLVRKKA